MADIYTQAGEELITDFTTGDAAAPASYYVGWGIGAGTAAKGDTTLFTEAAEARVAATETQPLADKAQWVATMTCAGAGKTITNAGVFNLNAAGVLLLHSDFTGVALNVGDKLEFTFSLQQS